jgi:hypothetical protein
MSNAGPARPPAAPHPPGLFSELKVSAHLMTLDTGLFCIVQTPGSPRPDPAAALPGVRISLPPGGEPVGAVSILAFRPDGWLAGAADAALVRVGEGPAQILVTIYQAPGSTESAPRLQVLRLAEEAARPAAPLAVAPAASAAVTRPQMLAHMQIRGDVAAQLGEWIGERGSQRWIEGFVINPPSPLTPGEIEYQGLLGRDWLSPWVEGGQLCGSRGMALPLLGLRVRLHGAAAEGFTCQYHVSFVDGTQQGPLEDGGLAQSPNLAAVEAFQLLLTPREAAPAKAAKAGARRPR